MAFTDHKLKFTIDADGKAARTELLDIDRLIGKVGSGLGGWAGPAAAAATGVAAVGAAAVGAGVALFNLTKHAADYGSEIFDASKKTGLHAEALSAMDFAAKQSGASMEQITGGIAKFAKTVGEAADGSDKAAAKLKDFGISPQEAINDLDGALGKVFKRITDAAPGIDRITLAQKAFGKSGADLLPFLDSFDGDLAGLIKKAKDLGVTIDDEAAAAADRFGDDLDTLNQQLKHVEITIGNELMPTFTEMAEYVSSWLATNQGEVKSWGETFRSVLESVGASIRNELHDLDEIGEFLKQAGKNISNGELFNWEEYYQGVEIRKEQAGFAKEELRYRQEMARYEREMARYGQATRKHRTYGAAEEGSGVKKRPPKETDAEFRKFFEERGFHVNRTFGGEINKGSLHPSGQAADIRVQGKSVAEVFALTAAALEKGYRLFDERVKRPGVKQTGPHQHYERGGSLKESGFLGADMYGGEAQLAYLKNLDAQRLGKASGQTGFQSFLKEIAEDPSEIRAGLRQMADEMIAAEQQASESRLSIRQKEADQAQAMLEGMVQTGEITEREAVTRVGQLRLDMLREEQTELEGQIPTVQNIQRLEELRLEIGTQELHNINEEYGYWKGITDEINKQNAGLQKRNTRPGGLQKRIPGAAGPGLGAEIAQGMGVELVPMFDAATGAMITFDDRMAMVGANINDFVGNALGGMIEGLAQMGAAWLAGGDISAAAALQMVSAAAFSVATQAGFKAIFEFAEGLAAEAATFGVPNPSSIAHFAAAGTYATVAAIAGGVGVAAGLGARAAGGGSKSSSGGRGSSSSASSQQQQVSPYSRQTDDVYISGRRNTVFENIAAEIRNLHKKIGSMSPGEVLTAGARQKKGFIGTQAVDDMKTRPQLGTRMLRQTNAR